jgi:hypothetical protein
VSLTHLNIPQQHSILLHFDLLTAVIRAITSADITPDIVIQKVALNILASIIK